MSDSAAISVSLNCAVSSIISVNALFSSAFGSVSLSSVFSTVSVILVVSDCSLNVLSFETSDSLFATESSKSSDRPFPIAYAPIPTMITSKMIPLIKNLLFDISFLTSLSVLPVSPL